MSSAALVSVSPGLPCDAAGPVFAEPWEAEAFAMTIALMDAGLFSPGEWAQALGAAITRAQRDGDPDLGDTYYHHWLAALEGLVAAKGMTDPDELEGLRQAWDRAARATPHGQPISLDADPLAPS